MEAPVPRYRGVDKPQGDGDTEAKVSIDNIEKTRDAIDAWKLYTYLATQMNSQIKIGSSPADASFTVYTTVCKSAEPSKYPPSENPQGRAAGSNGKNKWNVDHNLELQLLGFAFTLAGKRP